MDVLVYGSVENKTDEPTSSSYPRGTPERAAELSVRAGAASADVAVRISPRGARRIVQYQELRMIRTYQALFVASMLVAVVMATMYVRAGAQVVTPRPEELRFQALLVQPIATADRRSVVARTSALLVRDRVTDQVFRRRHRWQLGRLESNELRSVVDGAFLSAVELTDTFVQWL